MSLIQKQYWCDVCGCNHEIRHQHHDIENWLKKARGHHCIDDENKTKMFNTEYREIRQKNIFTCINCRKHHTIASAKTKYLPSKCCRGHEMVFKGVFIDMIR